LTEGDSAKALALCGIEELGRDFFGVYPLRGKPANVKSMTPKMLMENVELSSIVKIVGLTFGKEYASTKDLRYGSVMIMADQDIDGSHIKGLVINFFQTFWPSLCQIEGFLKEFITPIVKCKKGN
jgi:DNA topoisomerase II